ncbi:GerMN domain-containing protein [Flexivirga meconopsidis]|uniref:GerMN domain-containing protein n=1 Tax=Flexivirga meconopsidis TaxID=2977121 RepID=UPI00223F2F07|nr:LpqB family beta-propeller domain-containing protein [Flexivirga meconopsidis]
MRRRIQLLFISFVTTLLLAGCGGLPSSGPVRAGGAIDNQVPAAAGNIDYPPPQPGASQKDIVNAFLDAGAERNSDFPAARKYLTPEASASWKPRTVSVSEGQPDTQVTGNQVVTATVKRVATLDDTGHLSQGSQPATDSVRFSMAKVGGEWRISALPKDFGLWMRQDLFEGNYQPQTVYYPAARGNTLVPDVQWYPATGLVSSLAAAVLRGPSEWMQGMTMAALPSGSALGVSSVPVDNNGLATVDLSERVLGATPAQRTALWASMLATLRLGDVRRVVLEVGGARLQAPGLPQEPTTPGDVGYQVVTGDSTAMIVRSSASQLTWYDTNDVGGAPGRPQQRAANGRVKLPTINRNWYRLAASGDGTQIAAVDGSNSQLGRWVDGKLTQLRGFGEKLVRPSFSSVHLGGSQSVDELWIAGQSASSAGTRRSNRSGATVWVIDTSLAAANAQPQPIDAPWIGDRSVVALKVAPEGQRVALVLKDAEDHTTISLAGIVRDSKGAARSLTKPTTVAPAVDDVRDVAWIDYVTLGVLGVGPTTDAVHPLSAPLGQFVTDLGAAPGANGLVSSGAGSSSLYVTTDRNTVLTRVGAAWQPVDGAIDLIAPGS